MTITIDEDIIGLDVSVDESERMNALDSASKLSDVESSELLVENTELDEQVHEVTAGNIVHDHVEILVVLERVVEFDYPFAVGYHQDVALGFHVRRLVLREYVRLLKLFHGVEHVAIVFFAHQIHSPECTYVFVFVYLYGFIGIAIILIDRYLSRGRIFARTLRRSFLPVVTANSWSPFGVGLCAFHLADRRLEIRHSFRSRAVCDELRAPL